MLLGFFVIVVISIIVVGLIVVYRPDATATMIQFVGTTLALCASSAVLFYGLNETNKKLAKVDSQTNGRLTAERAVNEALAAELRQAQSALLHVVGASPAVTPPTSDTHMIAPETGRHRIEDNL